MIKINKVLGSIMMLGLMVIFMGCNNDELIELETNSKTTGLNFEATNYLAGTKKNLTASSNGKVTVITNNTVNIEINGQSTVVSTSRKSNELPVVAGNEVELSFAPSCPEETEAFFTMPDGTTQKVTSSAPSFKWTVPENFKSGMKIKGESNYETEDAKYKATGEIILISIENYIKK